MRRYTNVEAIYYSFFSRDLYRDVGRNWQGIGLAYIFVCLFLFLLIPVGYNVYYLRNIATQTDFTLYRDKHLFGTSLTIAPILDFIDQFPNLKIEGGKVSTDVPQPYYIFDPTSTGDSKKPFLIIDTTGATQGLKDSPAVILITADNLITRESDGSEKKRIDFAQVNDASVDKYTLLGWLRWQPLVYFPGILIVHFLAYTVNAMIFGLFGVALCRFMKIDFAYKPNIRLAAVTTTPVIMLEVLSTIFNDSLFMKPSLIYMLAHAAYMYHAVESNKK